jgi:hypothetical protein
MRRAAGQSPDADTRAEPSGSAAGVFDPTEL